MRRNQILSALLLVVCAVVFSGCEAIYQVSSEGSEKAFRPIHKTPTESNDLSTPFYATKLGESTSAQVLESYMNTSDTLSQSESVIGIYGSDKKQKKAWFNIAAFNEESLTSTRKYFLSSYDRPTEWFVKKEKLRFEAEIVMDRAVLDEAYANADAKTIAVLKKIRLLYNADIQQLTKYSRDMGNIGMLPNQSMNIVLTTLSQNSSDASKLLDFEGLDFDHPTLNEGKIRLKIDDESGIVKLKIKIGSVIDTWDEQEDVKSF